MIVDYGVEDRAQALRSFYRAERRREAKHRFRKLLRYVGAAAVVGAALTAGFLYAIGYF